VQFDPDELHRSIDLIAGLDPDAVYATHFGQVRDVGDKAAALHRQIDALVRIALANKAPGIARHARMTTHVET